MSGMSMQTSNFEYQGQGPESSSLDNASEVIVEDGGHHSTARPSSIFTGPGAKPHDDLKQMLESSKDGLKLEAMKRLVAMIAKGRSSDSAARELFPSVVKNVVTKNVELKKLVYLYLTRYAEQEQDLALLSISSFQRSLKDPNPLIRGSALRVLSSIRVPMIAPIMLVAIKDCANDMSPYVRKTAAHAIPKLYSLDGDLKDETISVIERLLNDKTSLVLGSAVAAFEEVCPDRLDLIDANYRKFASLMADFDEWGQVILINMLIRYGRTQFLDPAKHDNHVVDADHRLLLRNSKPLLQSRNSAVVMAVVQLHLTLGPSSETNVAIVRPLIRLLHSQPEIQVLVLSNIVTLTSQRNGQGSKTPATIANQSGLRVLFEPYLKSFFVKAKDSTQAKVLKLEILTNLSTSSNIALILREFQAYIENYQEGEDGMAFVGATIQAIGRCATRIREVAPVCLNGLIALLSNRNEAIVAQSIIVIRTQIMNREQEDRDQELAGDSHESNQSNESSSKTDSIVSLIIKQVTKLMDKISTSHARATIIWILAEFCSKNAKAYSVAPDVLRKMAKTYANESDLVKLQTMTLAAKILVASHPNLALDIERVEFDRERLTLLVNYVFQLAKYDTNYDIRDRGRFLKQLLNEMDNRDSGLSLASRILLTPKRATMKSGLDGVGPGRHSNSSFRVGTLSHFTGKRVAGYADLPDFPDVQPDPSVRDRPDDVVEDEKKPTFELITRSKGGGGEARSKTGASKSKDKFYSSSEEDDDEEEEDEASEDEDEEESEDVSVDESEEDEEESSEEEEDEDEDEDEDESDEEEEEEVKPPPRKVVAVAAQVKKPQVQLAGSKKAPAVKIGGQKSVTKSNSKQAVDLLLDFDGGQGSEQSGGQQTGSILLPPMSSLSLNSQLQQQGQQSIDPNKKYRIIEYSEILPTATFDLVTLPQKRQVLIYRFPRVRESNYTLVELVVRSESEEETSFGLRSEAGQGVVQIKGQSEDGNELRVATNPGEIKLITLAIDFKESPSQGVELAIDGLTRCKISAPIGEIIMPVKFRDLKAFEEEQTKLCGMNEVNDTITVKAGSLSRQNIANIVLKAANFGSNVFEEDGKDEKTKFAAATLKSACLLLVSYEWTSADDGTTLIKQRVNCERMMIGSIMAKALKDVLLKSF